MRRLYQPHLLEDASLFHVWRTGFGSVRMSDPDRVKYAAEMAKARRQRKSMDAVIRRWHEKYEPIAREAWMALGEAREAARRATERR